MTQGLRLLPRAIARAIAGALSRREINNVRRSVSRVLSRRRSVIDSHSSGGQLALTL